MDDHRCVRIEAFLQSVARLVHPKPDLKKVNAPGGNGLASAVVPSKH